jgi:hypothetical protein
MKRFLLALALCGIMAGNASARQSSADSSKVRKKTVSVYRARQLQQEQARKDSLKSHGKLPGGFFSLTFSRFDIGFSKLLDNGSFNLSPANQFLDYRSGKTSNVGFDILQLGYRFNSNFRVYVAGGFDWTHIRLEKNITILRDQPVLNYQIEPVDFDKNRFSSAYIRIPMGFDLKSKADRSGKSFHVVVGPETGFLIGGKVKQVSDVNGKQKFKDDYHFSEFRYGAYARIGYGGAGLFYKQYFNDMFVNSPAQKGLKNMAFGLMLGF